MAETIRSHKALRVYQDSIVAAMRVFEVTKHFPPDERFGLTSQIRNSSRSVPANIAEAWRRRRYPAHFVSKLNDCEGEAAETTVHVEMARLCDYLSVEESDELEQRYDQILAQLVKMIQHPEQWTIR